MLQWVSKTLRTEDDFELLKNIINKTERLYGAFDTETTGLNIGLDTPFLFQFGFIDEKTKLGYTFVVDIEQQEDYSRAVITYWHSIAVHLKKYLAHNTKFDLHMLHNINLDYTAPNLSDTQFYIRYAHDALTPANGGPPLGLKDYAARYISSDAKLFEKELARERSAIAKELNIKLKMRLNTSPKSKKRYTMKDLLDMFKDPIFTKDDLPEDIKEAYLEWLHNDVPVWLRNKITSIAEADLIPYNKLNRENVIKYAHYDIIYTLEIFLFLKDAVIARKNTEGIKIEEALILPFLTMEQTGFKINKDYLLNAQLKMKEYIKQEREKLYKIAGCKFAIGQHDFIKKLFLNKYNITVPSTDKNELDLLHANLLKEGLNEPAEFIEIVQELRTLEKWYSVYIMRFLKDLKTTDKLYTQINQVGTVSGRVTSDFQQFPSKGIVTKDGEPLFNPREMVVPEKDALVYMDYSQIELRFQAFYTILVKSPDLNLCRAYMPYKCVNKQGELFDYTNPEHIKNWNKEWYFEEAPDTHWIATDVHGATTEKATGLKPTDEGFARARKTIGKKVNFAKNYGAKYNKIRQMFPDKTDEEIKRIDDAYYAAFPGVKEYHNYCYQRAANYSNTTNLFDVHYYNVSGHKLVNMLVQGSAAFFLKLKIIAIYNYMKQHKMKSRLQMQIHDELCWEAVKGEEEHFFKLKEIMEEWEEGQVPVVAEMDAAKTTWADKTGIANVQELKELM